MWLFTNLIQETAKAAFSYRVTAEQKNHQQEGKQIALYRVASYLLETYSTDAFIAEAETKIETFKQPVGMTVA